MGAMIRALREDEFCLIEEWRSSHFAAIHVKSNMYRPIVGQRGFSDAFWVCIDRKGKPVAAASFTDEGRYRWVHDLYGAPGDGLAALALAEAIERMCDSDGVELRGDTDPENVAFIRILLTRGYDLTRVGFRRPPRVASEKSNGSGATAPAEKAEGAVSILGRRHAKV